MNGAPHSTHVLIIYLIKERNIKFKKFYHIVCLRTHIVAPHSPPFCFYFSLPHYH
jgi:hypothetical protein